MEDDDMSFLDDSPEILKPRLSRSERANLRRNNQFE